MSSLIGDLGGWATDVIEKLGYWGLALMVALENVFPPIPSEVVLPMAGFLTGDGRMNYGLALLAATIGSVVGAGIFVQSEMPDFVKTLPVETAGVAAGAPSVEGAGAGAGAGAAGGGGADEPQAARARINRERRITSPLSCRG